MSQPKERQKMMSDRRLKTQDKHKVEAVNPIAEMSEYEVHEDMDKNGSEVKDVMQATEEINAAKTKAKEKARLESSKRRETVKKRVEKMEARDKKSGLLDKAQKNRERGKK